MFRETVTSADGSTTEGTCSEEHATALLRTAVRRGYRAEATRQGGAVITREVPGPFVPRKHVVTLEPLTPAGRVTETQRRDLAAIDHRAGVLRPDGRIKAGFACLIPPAAAARLIQGGLVTVTGTAVTM